MRTCVCKAAGSALSAITARRLWHLLRDTPPQPPPLLTSPAGGGGGLGSRADAGPRLRAGTGRRDEMRRVRRGAAAPPLPRPAGRALGGTLRAGAAILCGPSVRHRALGLSLPARRRGIKSN